MEREHGRRKNRSAEKHGVMTNGGGGFEGGHTVQLPTPPTHPGARETDEH